METLEAILQEMGCKKPFLNEPTVNADGSHCPFTTKGSETYSRLIRILYTVGDLTEINMNEVVERLDDVAEEIY